MIRYIQAILKHSKLIIAIFIIITIVMIFQVSKIGTDTDVNTLMLSQNARLDKIRNELGVDKEVVQYVFISIRRDRIANMQELQAFQETIDAISKIPGIITGFNPFNFLYFESQNRRIIPTTISPTGRAPQNSEELAIFEQRIKANSLSENLISAESGSILTAVFICNKVKDIDVFMEQFHAAMEPIQEISTVYYTGEIPFQSRVAYYLNKDFSSLLILALVVMLAIFWLSFRSRRAVCLPVIVVGTGVIWTLGLMSLLDFKITVITVIIPSMLLAIGSSYTIHILSEYYRSARDPDMSKIEWLANAVEHVLSTIIVSALTTIICFLSLLTTTVRPLREFGLSIGMGILFSALLALFFLPSIFYLMKLPKPKNHQQLKNSFLTGIVVRTGMGTMKHKRKAALGVAVLIGLFILSYPRIIHKSDYFSYFPTDDPLITGSRFINQHSGGSQTLNITLTAPENKKGYFLDIEILKKIEHFELIVGSHPSVTNKLSFNSILRSMNKAATGQDIIPESRGIIQLLFRYFRMIPREKVSFGQDSSIINDDANQITIYLKLAESGTYSMINEEDMQQILEFVNKEVLANFSGLDAPEATLWGNTLLVLDSSRTIKRDQFRSTLISILLGMTVTWICFRSFAYSLIALIPLSIGIFFYYISLYLFRIPLDMTTILVTNLTVGVGLDDAVHFILQYQRLRRRHNCSEAISKTLSITGRAIVLTTISLTAGLLVLCFGSFRPVMYFGLLVAGSLFSTMVGTITLLPAVLTVLDRRMPKLNTRKEAEVESSFDP